MQGCSAEFSQCVGVKRRPVGQRQDFPSPRILNNHRASQRPGLLHGRFQLALHDVLDLFIDREHQIGSGFRLALYPPQPLPARIEGDQHATRFSSQAGIVAALQACQAFIVHAHIAQHLRRKLALGIKPLRFLLEINPFQIQSAHPAGGFRIYFSRHPAEGAR